MCIFHCVCSIAFTSAHSSGPPVGFWFTAFAPKIKTRPPFPKANKIFFECCATLRFFCNFPTRLKAHSDAVRIVLVDPPGSALCRRINTGVAYNDKDAEGHRLKHPFDTVTEGIGLNRITQNFERGIPHCDVAFAVEDLEATLMSRWLLKEDGIFCGSSAGVNCCGVVKAVKRGLVKPGETVVTILCDSGMRHLSKFWNPEYMAKYDLLCPDVLPSPLEFVADPTE